MNATANTTTDSATLTQRLDALHGQLGFLVERQRKQEELFAELTPILREVMATAVGKLDRIEKQGWFTFAGALGDVGARVVEHYSADDVHALGDAIVTILDMVRGLTQPEVLAIVGQAGEVLQHADQAEPIGLVGLVRAARHDDVQKGMAVLMDLLRHVGRAAQALADKAQKVPAADDRKARLAEALGPRRARAKKALGIERTPAPRLAAHPNGNAAAKAAGSGATSPPAVAATLIDGIAFTAEGHLVDPSQWTHTLAEHIAAAQGLSLGPEHWRLIDSARAEFEEKKVAANIRRLTQVAGVSTKDIFALFPKAPGRTIARIAGTPKPAGCI